MKKEGVINLIKDGKSFDEVNYYYMVAVFDNEISPDDYEEISHVFDKKIQEIAEDEISDLLDEIRQDIENGNIDITIISEL